MNKGGQNRLYGAQEWSNKNKSAIMDQIGPIEDNREFRVHKGTGDIFGVTLYITFSQLYSEVIQLLEQM